jgi:hypothetical protein
MLAIVFLMVTKPTLRSDRTSRVHPPDAQR